MLFNSSEFVFFFLLVLLVYHVLPLTWSAKKNFLLVASYLFYSAWNPPFTLLLLASTLADYAIAGRIHTSSETRVKRAWLTLSCVIGIGILVFFKYSKFLFANTLALLPLHMKMPEFIENIVLPAGVSFYTFQSISYTIDVYRGQLKPAQSLRDFALFVSFFPQLVAGPIVRAAEFLPQLGSRRRVDSAEVLPALDQIARGFAKKVILADTLAAYVDVVFADPGAHSSLNLLLGVYAYAFQIYYDFSGYSDIALGSARLLGFTLVRNFDLPYLSANPSEFWRRWHVSLSTWLRDYLYISLGGSRKGAWKTYRNLLLTMLLGGLWHGAAWGFVVWGVYHGLLLVVHRLLFTDWKWRGLPRVFAIPVMFHLVCLGWIPFRAKSLDDSWTLISGLAKLDLSFGFVDAPVLLVLALSAPLHVFGASAGLKRLWLQSVLLPRAVFYSAVILVLLSSAHSAAPFIYFQF